jgi:hypothetical protein
MGSEFLVNSLEFGRGRPQNSCASVSRFPRPETRFGQAIFGQAEADNRAAERSECRDSQGRRAIGY